MALTEAERNQALDILGFAAGVTDFTGASGPIVLELTYRTNASAQLERVNAYGEIRIRAIFIEVADAETKLAGARCRLAAEKVGGIRTRLYEADYLEDEYRRWGWRLAEVIGANPNPWSRRYQTGINVARAG